MQYVPKGPVVNYKETWFQCYHHKWLTFFYYSLRWVPCVSLVNGFVSGDERLVCAVPED